jgi:hypothetical protein
MATKVWIGFIVRSPFWLIHALMGLCNPSVVARDKGNKLMIGTQYTMEGAVNKTIDR